MSNDMNVDRKFLHDLSSPLAALRVHMEMLMEEAKSGKLNAEKSLVHIEKGLKLIDRCVTQIQCKRDDLLKENS